MKFTVPALGYANNALEPAISSTTIDLHYGKHLQTYLKNLNELLPNSTFEESTLEDIICSASGALYNNAAQVWNHIFYFDTLSPNPKRQPEGALRHAIELFYGSFDEFARELLHQGATLFGAGWVWFYKDAGDQLYISQESNAGNPLRAGHTPLLTLDVWEHAYYVDYQNRRADHLAAAWKLIDWATVERRYLEEL